jgi:hypothetical protein
MIHQFTREEFEAALPISKKGVKLWEFAGNDSELLYKVYMNDPDDCYIFIRSSMNPLLEIANDAGTDSIRLFLHDADGTSLIAKSARTKNYVTRVKGWEDRLWSQFSSVRKIRQAAGNCPVCDKPNKIYRVKYRMSMNWDELFAKCRNEEHYRNSFKILTRKQEFVNE